MSVAVIENTGQRDEPKLWKSLDLWGLYLPMLAIAPLLLVQFQRLMNRPERQFFPLLVLIALYFPVRSLLDNQGKPAQPLKLPRVYAALAAYSLAAILFVYSALVFSPLGSQVSALIVLFAWMLIRCSAVSWTSVVSWVGLLMVTVPLPLGMDERFVGWLQSASSAACSYALDAISVPHVRLANVIEIQGHQLFVEEACSGIGSMYALLAAAALLVVLNGRSFLVAAITLLSVPVWAMFGNFLRLVAIALAQQWYGRDLSHGLDHDLLGVLTFSAGALGMWMTEWLATGFAQPLPPSSAELSFIFRPLNAALCWPNSDPLASIVDTENETPQERMARQAREHSRSEAAEAAMVRVYPWQLPKARLVIRGVAIAVLLVGLLPAVIIGRDASPRMFTFGLTEFTPEQMARMPNAESMPEVIGEWRRADFSRENRSVASAMGAHSLIWEYRKGERRYLISVDFPFLEKHLLEVCYRNAGWNVDGISVMKDTSEDGWEWREIVMNNEFSSHGFVCYSMVTEAGLPFFNNPDSAFGGTLERLRKSVANRSNSVFQTQVYQIQLICEQGRSLTGEEMNEIRDQYVQARRALRSELVKAFK